MAPGDSARAPMTYGRYSHDAPGRRPFKPGVKVKAPKMAAPIATQREADLLKAAETSLQLSEAATVSVTVALTTQPAAPAPGGAFSLSVVFPGSVTREGCFRFICELLKHVLYQRQQLPLPYEQLACFCRMQLPKPASQEKDMVRKVCLKDQDNKKCQQVLNDLEGVFQHLEIMFNLTLVPRVLILLGGTAVSPKELYEINLQDISMSGTEGSLSTSACVRKLFRSLFMADVFSELQAVPTMSIIVMAQGHRNCGIDWFRPKLNYKVPTRGKKLTVNLSCSHENSTALSTCREINSAWDDYIWFQAPVIIKGFNYFS